MWHLETLASDDPALAARGKPFHERLDSQGCGARSEAARDALLSESLFALSGCSAPNSLWVAWTSVRFVMGLIDIGSGQRQSWTKPDIREAIH